MATAQQHHQHHQQQQQRKHPWWIRSAPEVNPAAWFHINIVCAVTSLVVFLDLLIAQHDASKRPVASFLYLAWDFGTTLIWCAEIGLTVAYRLLLPARERGGNEEGCEESGDVNEQASTTTSTKNKNLSIEHWAELAIAVLLLVDSAEEFYEHKLLTGSLGLEAAMALLNVVIFTYMGFRTWQSAESMRVSPSGGFNGDGDGGDDSDELMRRLEEGHQYVGITTSYQSISDANDRSNNNQGCKEHSEKEKSLTIARGGSEVAT